MDAAVLGSLYDGHVATALVLLAAGADVNLRCGRFKRPVMFAAAEKGLIEILRGVIEHGAEVDAVDTYQTAALHFAARRNKTESIDVLVEVGADIEARDRDGNTPLYCASSNLSREALLCLLKHGANVNAQNDSLETSLVITTAFVGRQGAAADMVDSLLMVGADETIVDAHGSTAADLIGECTREDDHLAEDIEVVRKLLANAPADRAWRRRGYLALCRAHPDRVQQQQVIDGTHDTDTVVARRTRSRGKLARPGGVSANSRVDESTGGDWTVVVSKVLLLQEEGIFWTIVGFL